MKRHSSLIPLSHDHHDGLVLAQQLIRGYDTGSRAGQSLSGTQVVSVVVDFFETQWRPHCDLEEVEVFPWVLAQINESEHLIQNLIREHREMAEKIRDLKDNPTTRLSERLSALGQLMRSHIRTEERVLFQWMQEKIPVVKLDALGSQLSQYAKSSRVSGCRVSLP